MLFLHEFGIYTRRQSKRKHSFKQNAHVSRQKYAFFDLYMILYFLQKEIKFSFLWRTVRFPLRMWKFPLQDCDANLVSFIQE